MNRVEEYRQNAAACRDLAEKLDGSEKQTLLKMADTWERLAREHERRAPDWVKFSRR